MEVEIGKEALHFENGAFSHYGMAAVIMPLPIGEYKSSNTEQYYHETGGNDSSGIIIIELMQGWTCFCSLKSHPASYLYSVSR